MKIQTMPVLVKGSEAQHSEEGMRVTCLGNSKKASLAGARRAKEE